MRQPEGYHIGSPNMVFRLRKSLYGLKQAARQWNKKLRGVLEGIGYTRLRSDSSIYTPKVTSRSLCQYSLTTLLLSRKVMLPWPRLSLSCPNTSNSVISGLLHFCWVFRSLRTLLLAPSPSRRSTTSRSSYNRSVTSYHYLPLLEVSVKVV